MHIYIKTLKKKKTKKKKKQAYNDGYLWYGRKKKIKTNTK